MISLFGGRGYLILRSMDGGAPITTKTEELYRSATCSMRCQHATGRIFAAFLQRNNKARFFLGICVRNPWYPQQKFSAVLSEIADKTPGSKCFSVSAGWAFHGTDNGYSDSSAAYGLVRGTGDSLHFLYENDGSEGYSRKGTGTQQSRQHRNSTIYCVLNLREVKDDYDFSLAMNSLALVRDDVPPILKLLIRTLI